MFEECEIGRNNANMLLETLSIARSCDLEREIIQVSRIYCNGDIIEKLLFRNFGSNAVLPNNLLLLRFHKRKLKPERLVPSSLHCSLIGGHLKELQLARVCSYGMMVHPLR